ncbi:MAG: GIY-YIG nuclease family protein [Dehalogenimonas sp.]
MKLERNDVRFPLWRKKVDSSLFQHGGTTIPTWACAAWDIQTQFESCNSKKSQGSEVVIRFCGAKYEGWVTCAKHGRISPAYRLFFQSDLEHKLKDVFLMSFMRDIEKRLRPDSKTNIEEEIPFWEFLDIEYDKINRTFLFSAHYTQKPSFPELFKRLIGSPMLHKIDDELNGKNVFRIYPQDWKPRSLLESEIEADNVLYTLLDSVNNLIYVGEARQLVKRLQQEHPTIPHWDFYRYNVLPSEITDY